MSVFRNAEGYYDPTAGKAIENYKNGGWAVMEYRKGDIFEYKTNNNCETRKAIIVSCDERKNDKFVNIILLIREPLGIRANAKIICEGVMYADCGMVTFCNTEKLTRYIRSATEEEMCSLNDGIKQCFGFDDATGNKDITEGSSGVRDCENEIADLKTQLEIKRNECVKILDDLLKATEEKTALKKECEELKNQAISYTYKPEDLIRAETERDLFKGMYERLFDRLVEV